MNIFTRAGGCYCKFCCALDKALRGWFPGLAARFVFAAVLLNYYIGSALTKVGSGFPDFFIPQVSAYAQILPDIAASYNYDITTIPFFPYGLVVLLGTYGEFILPFAIVLGLFTRLSALAMMIFIVVQTYVDIYYHGAASKGADLWFDNIPDGIIADQRLLWLFVLVVLVAKGAGFISLDSLLCRLFCRSSNNQPIQDLLPD